MQTTFSSFNLSRLPLLRVKAIWHIFTFYPLIWLRSSEKNTTMQHKIDKKKKYVSFVRHRNIFDAFCPVGYIFYFVFVFVCTLPTVHNISLFDVHWQCISILMAVQCNNNNNKKWRLSTCSTLHVYKFKTKTHIFFFVLLFFRLSTDQRDCCFVSHFLRRWCLFKSRRLYLNEKSLSIY